MSSFANELINISRFLSHFEHLYSRALSDIKRKAEAEYIYVYVFVYGSMCKYVYD